MKKGSLYEKMANIDEKYIEEAAVLTRFRVLGKKRSFRSVILLAATLSIMICAVIAIPLMRRNDAPVLDFEDFEIVEKTIVAYTGDGVEELQIPEGVEEIANYAFLSNENSKKIKVITLSSTVKGISENSFAGCYELEELIIGDNKNFEKKDDLLLTSDGEMIIEYLGDGSEGHFTVPEGIKYIAAHSFQGTALKTVDFPSTLLYIGYNAFASCALESINIPENVIEIADGAFAWCTSALTLSYSDSTLIGKTTFEVVPAYLTMLAGGMSPSEEIARGISITDAFRKSNGEIITEQIKDILHVYSGGEISDNTFCYGAIYEGQPLPDGVTIPMFDSLDFASLDMIERNWESQTNIGVRIPCTGGYDMIIGFRLYDRWDKLYWKDVKWRAESITFVPTDVAANADLVIGDWYIEFEIDESTGAYTALTFTSSDGSISVYEYRFPSNRPYNLIPSPDGKGFIVEYWYDAICDFFVEDLSGALYQTWWSFKAPCVPYDTRAYGRYIPGSAEWNTDPETKDVWPVKAENINGVFLINYITGDFDKDNLLSFYDVLYTGEEPELSGERLYDGADKYNTDIVWVGYIREIRDGAFIREYYDPSLYNIKFDTPHTWVGFDDRIRSEKELYAWRIDMNGSIHDVGKDFTLDGNTFSFYSFPQNVDPLKVEINIFEGDGENITAWGYCTEKQVIFDSVRTNYYVNVQTASGHLILLTLYSYRDGDAPDYFEKVLVPLIESVRLCPKVTITDMSATNDGEKSVATINFNDSNGNTISGKLDLAEVENASPINRGETVTWKPGEYSFIGFVNHYICEYTENGKTDYYFYFEDRIKGQTFVLEDGNFKRIG